MLIGDSCPLWILGPKLDPFGGTYPGITDVSDRLSAICALPLEVCSHTSFHMVNEVRTGIDAYSGINSPTAMKLSEVTKMLRDAGKKVLCVTVPAFGQPDLWQGGAILSENAAVRIRSEDLIREGAETCLSLQEDGIGEGVFIWWPGTDSLRFPFTPEQLTSGRRSLIDFWVRILTSYPKLRVWLEWKPADPGDRDHFAFYKEAIAFAWAVNFLLGRTAVLLNFEFAHASICGDDVDTVMEAILSPADVLSVPEVILEYLNIKVDATDKRVTQLVQGILVDLLVHVNSSVKKGPDQDKRVGAVNNEETQRAVNMLDAIPARVVAEHDIKCLDGDPVAYYKASVAALEAMRA